MYVIHTCGCDDNGNHIKGHCCYIEELVKENALLKNALKVNSERYNRTIDQLLEENKKMKEAIEKEIRESSKMNMIYIRPVHEDYRDYHIVVKGYRSSLCEEYHVVIDEFLYGQVMFTSVDDALAYGRKMVDEFLGEEA